MAEYTFHASRSQMGDTVQCQATAGRAEDSEQLLRRHDGLVHAVIRREGSGRLTYEEALQAGREGLWRATLGYDAGRDKMLFAREIKIVVVEKRLGA